MESIRVLLAVDAADLAEVVMDFLDRSGQVRVVATASDERQVLEATRQLEPDVVVATPGMLSAAVAAGPPIVVVDTDARTGSLRAALDHGAHAFAVWPDEREDLLRALGRAVVPAPVVGAAQAQVTAVVGARGGAGATFIATHLADALTRAEVGRVLLIDADFFGAGATVALGAARVEGVRTVQELVPVLGELTPEHLAEVLWRHPHGFDVALPPRSARVAADLSPAVIGALVATAASSFDHVVVDLPRAPEPLTEAARHADRVLVALPLDVSAFAAANRIIEVVPADLLEYVINLAARADVTPEDVPRVFGAQPVGVIPVERRVRAAQDRGRLLSARTRVVREFDRIAATFVAPSSAEEAA